MARWLASGIVGSWGIWNSYGTDSRVDYVWNMETDSANFVDVEGRDWVRWHGCIDGGI